MFGWTGFKYWTEVIVNIHSILMFVPELKALLKTFPNLKRAAGDCRKAGKTELEAAAYLSVVVLEAVLAHVPEDGRNETLAELTRFENDRLRWFRDQAADEGGKPIGVLPLTFALGFAFWFLGHAVRENRLPELVYRDFLTDVIGMLQGKRAR
ncbi:hypothetical protein [Bradyrhizobium sp. CW1]|uniref:hypothetical protein n=1 Tax=Bradyrhizobium sp. CW1 TaxID=2782686 RepID=UPI001FFED9E9|nr:hypothetical protein [Bradyrhizobium sp. CW1]UPJ25410.1 hypothetical protein IVB54_26585 [Bradyrhizobium sp. CW1]